MSSDAILTIEGLESRLKSASGRVTRCQALRDRLRRDLANKQDEVATLATQILIRAKVEELYKALIDALVIKQVKAIETMVTEGLQTIFLDQSLKFEAEIKPKYNKVSIDFYLNQKDASTGVPIKGKPLESFGGGPVSVASLLLRVLTLLRLKRYPLLLLDETLGAVSDEYTDSTGQFLKVLSDKMQVPILMITHKPAYLDHANGAYKGQEVEDGVGRRLEVTKVTT